MCTDCFALAWHRIGECISKAHRRCQALCTSIEAIKVAAGDNIWLMTYILWQVVGAEVRGVIFEERHTIEEKSWSVVRETKHEQQEALVASISASFLNGLLHGHFPFISYLVKRSLPSRESGSHPLFVKR